LGLFNWNALLKYCCSEWWRSKIASSLDTETVQHGGILIASIFHRCNCLMLLKMRKVRIFWVIFTSLIFSTDWKHFPCLWFQHQILVNAESNYQLPKNNYGNKSVIDLSDDSNFSGCFDFESDEDLEQIIFTLSELRRRSTFQRSRTVTVVLSLLQSSIDSLNKELSNHSIMTLLLNKWLFRTFIAFVGWCIKKNRDWRQRFGHWVWKCGNLIHD
jgi:hypothetical protein